VEKNNITAVEWFFDKIKSHFEHNGELMESIIWTYEQSKEMEKEQITDAYIMGSYDMAEKEFKPEKYYQETYGTE